jgi:hypothetical protein
MLTEELIREYCTNKNRAEKADTIIRYCGKLDLKVPLETEAIILTYTEQEKRILDYLLSFVPAELVEKLNPRKVCGAFVLECSGKVSFNSDVTLYCKDGNVTISVDTKNSKAYFDSWSISSESLKSTVSQYLEDKRFDCWIILK